MLSSSDSDSLTAGLLADDGFSGLAADDGSAPAAPSDEEDAPATAAAPSRPKPHRRLSHRQRAQRLIDLSSDSVEKLHPGAGVLVRSGSWAIAMAMQLLSRAAPFCILVYKHARLWYVSAPKETITMVFGGALCFFGGIYTNSIAAIEAFRQMGWERMYDDIAVIRRQASKIDIAQKRDDLKNLANSDSDLDKSSVDDPQRFLQRKLTVAMVAVDEPARLQSAIGALWAAYIAVLATLRLQFAQTTAMALGISEVFELPVSRIFGPLVKAGLGPKLAHWTETTLALAVKFVAIVLAWYLQMIISAFYSAVRGGRMFADGFCAHAIANGWSRRLEKIPGVSAPFDPDTTQLDEVIATLLGVTGFCFQFFAGFALPFPLNLIFLPFTIIEWMLRLQVTFTGGVLAGSK